MRETTSLLVALAVVLSLALVAGAATPIHSD